MAWYASRIFSCVIRCVAGTTRRFSRRCGVRRERRRRRARRRPRTSSSDVDGFDDAHLRGLGVRLARLRAHRRRTKWNSWMTTTHRRRTVRRRGNDGRMRCDGRRVGGRYTGRRMDLIGRTGTMGRRLRRLRRKRRRRNRRTKRLRKRLKSVGEAQRIPRRTSFEGRGWRRKGDKGEGRRRVSSMGCLRDG